MKKTKQLLMVTGKDRPGIIANVAGILYQHHCNLEDISMTILEGALAMMLVVSLDPKKKKTIEQSIRKLGAKADLSCDWKALKGAASLHAKHDDLYLISAVGLDHTGIVFQISRELSRRKLNIQDLNSQILGTGPKIIYAMVLEVAVPKHYPVPALKRSLQQLGKKLKVDITVKPVERFEF